MGVKRSLRNKEHSIQLSVTDRERGWEIRQEEDSKTVREIICNDWHSVERAVSLFDHRAAKLREQGWTDDGSSAPAGSRERAAANEP